MTELRTALVDALNGRALERDQKDEIIAEWDALHALAKWLVSLDDPEDVLGREERRTVTLNAIVNRARESVFEPRLETA